jgi:hypothetical protein
MKEIAVEGGIGAQHDDPLPGAHVGMSVDPPEDAGAHERGAAIRSIGAGDPRLVENPARTPTDATRYRGARAPLGLRSTGCRSILSWFTTPSHADAAQNIELKRPAPELLWHYRESVVGEFYGGLTMKLKMIAHVLRRSSGLHDAAAYMTLMGRKYDPAAKMRPVATV